MLHFKNFYTLQKQRKRLYEQIISLFDNKLLEQEIHFDGVLIEVLKKIKDKNKIAQFLFKTLTSSGNILNIDGEIKNVETVNVHDKKPDFFEIKYIKPNGSSAKSEMKIGKFLTALVKEMNDKNLKPKPQEIEDFVKLVYTDRTGETESNYEFKLVSGKDIKKYYHIDNYECSAGGLGASCMRHENTQDFIDFYVGLDPKQCSLLIRVNPENDKIVGRALLWTLDGGKKYLDRVYVADNKDMTLFVDYAKKTYSIKNSFDENDIQDFQNNNVTIKNWKLPKYMPYMDTFTFAAFDEKQLLLIPGIYSGSDNSEMWDNAFNNDDDYLDFFEELKEKKYTKIYFFGKTNGSYPYEDMDALLEMNDR